MYSVSHKHAHTYHIATELVVEKVRRYMRGQQVEQDALVTVL